MKHILFIFFDQLRYDAVGALGNPYVYTPALDSLAADSVIFERCYTPSPVCVPARLSLHAGQYPNRTGNCGNVKNVPAYHGKGFYSEFTENGFNTCCVGKMHYAWDLLGNIGFKKRYTQEPLANDDYSAFLRSSPFTENIFDYNGQRSDMYYVPQVSQLPAEYHPTQWIGDRSLDFLDSVDPDKENTFLFSSIFHPHPPFSPPAPWNKIYRSYDGIEPHIPENFDMKDIAPLLCTRMSLERFGISELDLKRLRNFYYACVSFGDYQVGRLIAELKRKKMYDDTLIIVSSDHGEMLGDFSTVGKRSMKDGAAHVPLMIKLPGVSPCRRSDVCSLVDLAPTLLSYAGIPYDKSEYDGVDLFSERHGEVFSQYGCGKTGVFMLVTDKDKLIYSAQRDRYYYYKDHDEDHDTYQENAPTLSAMKAKLDAYIAADKNMPEEKKKKPIDHPFNTKYKDDPYVYDREMSRVPPEYHLHLTDPGEVKKSDFLE